MTITSNAASTPCTFVAATIPAVRSTARPCDERQSTSSSGTIPADPWATEANDAVITDVRPGNSRAQPRRRGDASGMSLRNVFKFFTSSKSSRERVGGSASPMLQRSQVAYASHDAKADSFVKSSSVPRDAAATKSAASTARDDLPGTDDAKTKKDGFFTRVRRSFRGSRGARSRSLEKRQALDIQVRHNAPQARPVVKSLRLLPEAEALSCAPAPGSLEALRAELDSKGADAFIKRTRETTDFVSRLAKPEVKVEVAKLDDTEMTDSLRRMVGAIQDVYLAYERSSTPFGLDRETATLLQDTLNKDGFGELFEKSAKWSGDGIMGTLARDWVKAQKEGETREYATWFAEDYAPELKWVARSIIEMQDKVCAAILCGKTGLAEMLEATPANYVPPTAAPAPEAKLLASATPTPPPRRAVREAQQQPVAKPRTLPLATAADSGSLSSAGGQIEASGKPAAPANEATLAASGKPTPLPRRHVRNAEEAVVAMAQAPVQASATSAAAAAAADVDADAALAPDARRASSEQPVAPPRRSAQQARSASMLMRQAPLSRRPMRNAEEAVVALAQAPVKAIATSAAAAAAAEADDALAPDARRASSEKPVAPPRRSARQAQPAPVLMRQAPAHAAKESAAEAHARRRGMIVNSMELASMPGNRHTMV